VLKEPLGAKNAALGARTLILEDVPEIPGLPISIMPDADSQGGPDSEDDRGDLLE
jgi:hypothetical protein